jgi:hypothetical protein
MVLGSRPDRIHRKPHRLLGRPGNRSRLQRRYSVRVGDLAAQVDVLVHGGLAWPRWSATARADRPPSSKIVAQVFRKTCDVTHEKPAHSRLPEVPRRVARIPPASGRVREDWRVRRRSRLTTTQHVDGERRQQERPAFARLEPAYASQALTSDPDELPVHLYGSCSEVHVGPRDRQRLTDPKPCRQHPPGEVRQVPPGRSPVCLQRSQPPRPLLSRQSPRRALPRSRQPAGLPRRVDRGGAVPHGEPHDPRHDGPACLGGRDTAR